MQKTQVTLADIKDFQKTTWVAYAAQNGVYMEVNLFGEWRVRDRYAKPTFYTTPQDAYTAYVDVLINNGTPAYKVAIDLVFF